MTEGGGATIDAGRVTRVSIGTTEKLPARVRLVATGTAGHGSAPRLDNALIHLSAAVERMGRWEPPMRLNDTTRAYFEALANFRSPAEYSMLGTSVVPTMLSAGVGANVIPSEAEATLDIRALPGEDINAFYAE